MGIRILKKFLSKEKIYFCDRCRGDETVDWSNLYMLCESCYRIDPQTIRPQLIESNKDYGFSNQRPDHFICSVCHKILGKRMNFDLIKCKHVCNACVSKHPDKTHFLEFDQRIDHFLEGKTTNTVLVRNCHSCCGVLVIEIAKNEATFKYYKVGSKEYSGEPFFCTRNLTDHKDCVHDWVMLAGSKHNKGASLEKIRAIRNHPDPLIQMTYSSYLTDQRHWCYRCGLFYQVPSERLPIKGYL